MTYTHMDTLHSCTVLGGPPSIAPFVGSHVKKRVQYLPRACTSCNLHTSHHTSAQCCTLCKCVTEYQFCFWHGMRASSTSSLQEAGSSLDRIRLIIPTSVWTCHRHREFPSPLARAGMATTAPPSSGASALAWSIYRHSGPSSPRLGGGGLSKLFTNSYCSYVT